MKPTVVVLGHVTLDLIRRACGAPLSQQLGGAASFVRLWPHIKVKPLAL